MKLAIGLLISHGFPVPEAFATSYRRLWSRLITGQCNEHLPPELAITAVSELQQTSFPVDMARNEVCRAFLASDADALLFLDADMTFPEDAAERLVRAQKPVISGRYHMRSAPFHACAYVKHRVHTSAHAYSTIHFGRGVVEIERGGAGCLLIQREVLEAIRARQLARWGGWLGSDGPSRLPDWLRAMLPPAPVVQWFRYQHGPEPPHDMSVSEDFWFYQQAREAGFSCWLDWDCACGHLQTFPLQREWNEQYLEKQIASLSTLTPDQRQSTLDALVVCGYPDGLTLPTGDRVPPYAVTPGER